MGRVSNNPGVLKMHLWGWDCVDSRMIGPECEMRVFSAVGNLPPASDDDDDDDDEMMMMTRIA